MFCPHCGHQNEPETAQCAGCRRELALTPPADAAPSAAPAPSVKCAKCGFANPWDATSCHCCLALLERPPVDVPPPPPPTPGKWLGAAVGVVAALIVLAQVIHLLAPAPPQPAAPVPQAQAAATVQSTPTPVQAVPAPPPVVADEDPAPELQFRLGLSYLKQKKPAQARDAFEEVLQKYPASRFAADARAQLEQLDGGTGTPATSVEPAASAPFAAGDDLVAELQYRVAMSWMTRHEPAKARLAFEEVVKKYPGSSYAREARAKLAQLPAAAPLAPAQTVAPAQQPKVGPPSNTITNEDLRRLGSKSAASSAAQRAQTAPPPTAAEGGRTLPTLGDKLSMVSSEALSDKIILTLQYQLGLGRSHKVYAAARVVFPEPHSPVFAYSSETFQASSGMVLIQVPVPSQTAGVRPISVRLMMFEANGAMFYSQDIPWP